MKKSIKNLIERVQESGEGRLTGGFASIKGGMTSLSVANGVDCTNGGLSCGGTNNSGCTNENSCTGATNVQRCSNENICYR